MSKKLCQKDARLLFVLCWFAYCFSYFGRQNYAAGMNELISSVLTKQQAGWINTGFLVCYAAGQLVNGLLVEKHSPYLLGLIGIAGSGLLNLLFPLADSFGWMLALRSLTGCCMSMIWPSLLRCMVRYMRHEDLVWSSVQIASSTAVGSIGAYLMSSALLYLSGWKMVFVVPGILLLGCAAVWAIRLPAVASRATETHTDGLPDENMGKESPTLRFGALLVLPTVLLALVPTVFHGAIKDGVSSWIPTYICELFHCSTSFSVFVTTLLPVVNLFGAYAARLVYDRCQENVFGASSVFFGLAAVFLLILQLLGQRSLVLTLICFSVITSAMLAVNVLLINLFPLAFEKQNRSATVSGMLNAIAYAGSAATSGLIGVITRNGGWETAVVSWIAMMAIAFLICLAGKNAKARRVGV